MAMFVVGAVVGCVCGAIGYKYNAAAAAAIGVAVTIAGVIGYENIPALVDNTWGVGSCPATDVYLAPDRNAECVIDRSERVVAAFWFLFGGVLAAFTTYGILVSKYGEPPS